MHNSKPLSDAAKNATIERKGFDEALGRLLATPPLPKEAVSREIAQGRTTRARKPQAQR
jgi:hypothetical protein